MFKIWLFVFFVSVFSLAKFYKRKLLYCYLILITKPPKEPKVLVQIKAVEIHNLVPSRHKILHKLFLIVILSIDLSQSAQL